MDKSLEDILISIREKQSESYTNNSKNANSGNSTGALMKIREAINTLQETEHKYIEIQKTEKLQIKESDLHDILSSTVETWIHDNTSEIIESLKTEIQIKEISDAVLKSLIRDVVKESVSKSLNKMIFEYMKQYDSYIKEVVKDVINYQVKERLYEIIEDVIRKIMRNK